MSHKNIISYAYFIDLYKDGNGAAVCITNAPVSIICSKFIENTSSRAGGSLYFINTQSNISKNSFSHCRSTALQNDISGNAIYQEEGSCYFSQNSISLCSDSLEYCSDGATKLYKTLSQINTANYSSNYGISGASGISVWDSIKGTYVSFMNVYNVYDYRAMESRSILYIITKSNFVKFHREVNKEIFWLDANYMLSLVECCLYETDDVKLSFNNNIVQIIDCIIDKETPSFTYITTFSLNNIHLNIKCFQSIATCKENFFSSVHIKIMIHIIVLGHK